MNTVMCCVFACPNCGEHVRLPHKSLGYMFGPPGNRTIDAPYLAFPCPHCKHVEAYSLNQDSPYRRERYETILVSPPEIPTQYLGSLTCEQETCTVRIPLFAQWSDATNAAERKADTETWIWDHLLCPQGYSILKPTFHTEL